MSGDAEATMDTPNNGEVALLPPPPPVARGGKRYSRILRGNIQGIRKPGIRRLARRGGVKRLSANIYEETRTVLRDFLTTILRDAVAYMDHARRKTVSAMDVVYALKRNGYALYGYGS